MARLKDFLKIYKHTTEKTSNSLENFVTRNHGKMKIVEMYANASAAAYYIFHLMSDFSLTYYNMIGGATKYYGEGNEIIQDSMTFYGPAEGLSLSMMLDLLVFYSIHKSLIPAVERLWFEKKGKEVPPVIRNIPLYGYAALAGMFRRSAALTWL